jgi:hypothetical protein
MAWPLVREDLPGPAERSGERCYHEARALFAQPSGIPRR